MSLYRDWQSLIENQTDATLKSFWEEYSGAETKIYSDILAEKTSLLTGTVAHLSEKYQVREVIFMGFLDGVNTSLETELNLEDISSDTELTLKIKFEELFKNMLKAGADYLYSLKEWDDIFDDDRKKELTTEYRRSRTVKKEPKTGRNSPCPCGSGKKYKKCCGR